MAKHLSFCSKCWRSNTIKVGGRSKCCKARTVRDDHSPALVRRVKSRLREMVKSENAKMKDMRYLHVPLDKFNKTDLIRLIWCITEMNLRVGVSPEEILMAIGLANSKVPNKLRKKLLKLLEQFSIINQGLTAITKAPAHRTKEALSDVVGAMKKVNKIIEELVKPSYWNGPV